MAIFDSNNRLNSEALAVLKQHADMLECECPTHLIEILLKVRDFETYTADCIKKYPQDAKTHQWLLNSAQNIDTLISATIAQLARFEGFVSDENEFMARK